MPYLKRINSLPLINHISYKYAQVSDIGPSWSSCLTFQRQIAPLRTCLKKRFAYSFEDVFEILFFGCELTPEFRCQVGYICIFLIVEPLYVPFTIAFLTIIFVEELCKEISPQFAGPKKYVLKIKVHSVSLCPFGIILFHQFLYNSLPHNPDF